MSGCLEQHGVDSSSLSLPRNLVTPWLDRRDA